MAELYITLPDGRTAHHRLKPGPVVLGRDATCEVPIDDPSTSRRHARITPTERGYVVEDLGSRNGTLVNDTPAAHTVLRDGDRITVGAAVGVFRSAHRASATSVIVADEPPSGHATNYVPRDRRLALSQRRLETIYELSERLTTLQDQPKLLEEAMDICFEMLHFERGAIGIRRKGKRAVDWPVVRNLRGAEGELTISRSLLSRAMEHGERAIYSDDGGGKIDPTVSMVQHGIRSAMCVPLIHSEEILGVIYGDRTSTSTKYSDEDIDFLAAIGRQISIGLVNGRLLDEQRELARLNQDLDVARGIQNSLFPNDLPENDRVVIAALNDPGRRVSGDYYDVIERPDGKFWIIIADVSGEGVAAALLMANLQAAVRVTIVDCDDPGDLMRRWNRLVSRNAAQSKFITCLAALIDPAQRTVCLANAGHWCPMFLRGKTISATPDHAEPGFPLGVTADGEYLSATIELGSAPTTLFCYTDGVIEAMNPEQEPFGMAQLEASLREGAELTPSALVKHVRRKVTEFAAGAEQSDDITMLAVLVK